MSFLRVRQRKNNSNGVFCFGLSTSPRTTHIHAHAHFFIGLCFSHAEANATKLLYQLRTQAFCFPKRNVMLMLGRCSTVTVIKIANPEIKYYSFVIKTQGSPSLPTKRENHCRRALLQKVSVQRSSVQSFHTHARTTIPLMEL